MKVLQRLPYALNAYCGFSYRQLSRKAARKSALDYCRKGTAGKRGNGCEIVAEISEASPYVSNINACGSAGAVPAKIDACTALIDSKRDRGKDQAWNYNERGRAYQSLGKPDLAIADFTRAIQADKKFGWAYMNRARLQNKRSLFKSALADAKMALRLYKGGRSDYREEVRTMITRIEASLAGSG